MLNAATMAETIVENLEALSPGAPITDRPRVVQYWTAVCSGIILHIETDAVVTIPFVTGVQTGGGNSGPGTGTIA